jgi:two-component system phosphate regulon sensor histidine kinase PhoR
MRWLALLMITVILAITGFQIYWLHDNYQRESRDLDSKTGLLFRETYRQVQDSALRARLQLAIGDTSGGGKTFSGAVRLASGTSRALGLLSEELSTDSMASASSNMTITLDKKEGERSFLRQGRNHEAELDSIPPSAIREINIFSKQPLHSADSLASRVRMGDVNVKRTKPLRLRVSDSTRPTISQINTIYLSDGKEHNIVIRIDSLMSDSVQLAELNRKFAEALARENIDVPFSIRKNEIPAEKSVEEFGPTQIRWRAVRDTDPYEMQMGNRLPYLLKQLSLSILFSVFLVGITCLSFLLMYRSLRQQRRLTQLKSELVSNITHELKTPIATVSVAIEALKNFNAIQDPRRTREYLDISQQELHRLGLLVDKVLKLSMFEKREMEIQPQLFNLAELVDEVVASLRLQLEKNQARLTVDRQGDLNLKADRAHLQSVIFNLIDNALKYGKANPAIQISLKGEADEIVLSITDNGIGIPEAYRQKIFEKFFRVPAGDTHNAKGHGLGLSYVAQVLKQHGGSISVDSHAGLGSTFTIRLPREAAQNDRLT